MWGINIYYVFALLCTIGVFVFSYLAEKKAGDDDEKEMKDTIQQQGKELINRQDKLSRLTSENNKQIAISNTLGEENKRLAEENNRLANENNRLAGQTNQNTEQIIGAGSFPIISVGGGLDGQLQLIIMLKGKYAIPNLTATIVVVPDYTNVSGLDMKITPFFGKQENLETLRPQEFNSYFVPFNQKELAVVIYFKSDNHNWNGTIRIKKINEKIKILSIISDQENQYKWVRIDEDFPKNIDNTITLWSNTKVPFMLLKEAAEKSK